MAKVTSLYKLFIFMIHLPIEPQINRLPFGQRVFEIFPIAGLGIATRQHCPIESQMIKFHQHSFCKSKLQCMQNVSLKYIQLV